MANQYTVTRTSIQLPLPIDGETVEIPLTRGATLVDAIDADLAQFVWHIHEGYSARYIRVGSRYVHLMMHRIILGRVLERELVRGEEVDHINNNPMDNRRANLRLASRAENCRNTRKPKVNTSGYKGATFDKQTGKWRAQIAHRHLGRFDTPEEAHEAYCKAAKELYGEFARFE